MSVWQTETKAISRQKKLCGQGCSSNLKKDQSFPGQCIAVDHYICSTKGRLFTSRGNPNDTDMYTGGALFVDMNSKQVENVFQQHLNTHETLKAKQDFELKSKDAGVIPLEYISDNDSAFTSKSYAAHLSNCSQIQPFAGVGAHHHNGVAEKAIQNIIMSIARTMMLHSAIHWPEISDPSLWPMAVQYATYLYNKVPDPSTGLCPDDLFTKT